MKQIDKQMIRYFYDDMRRALLMHRRGRLACFFKLQFPNNINPLAIEADALHHLDFRRWLSDGIPIEMAKQPLIQELIVLQEIILEQADLAIKASSNNCLTPQQFIALTQTMHDFDRIAKRIISSMTTSLADIDQLTGLFNRAAMVRDLQSLDSQHLQSALHSFCIAMIDIDFFKRVNDNYGHDFGDAVLAELADRFIEHIRPHDRIYRYGGEEFLLVLPDTQRAEALIVLERLRACTSAYPIKNKIAESTQTISIGVAEADAQETSASVIKRADEALYRAKKEGRNRVC